MADLLDTPLTRSLGIEVPLICGAMYPCSNPELVAAVSAAGGIGVVQPISLTYVHGHDFREGLRLIRSLTSKPIGMNVLIEASSTAYLERMRKWLDIALDTEGPADAVTYLAFVDNAPATISGREITKAANRIRRKLNPHPAGQLDTVGLATRRLYFRDALAKLYPDPTERETRLASLEEITNAAANFDKGSGSFSARSGSKNASKSSSCVATAASWIEAVAAIHRSRTRGFRPADTAAAASSA